MLSTMMYALHYVCSQVLLDSSKRPSAITADQPFLTGRTYEEIMRKYDTQSALELLYNAHSGELQVAQHEDWLVEQTWNQAISSGLQHVSGAPIPDSDAEGEIWSCPTCSEQFITPAALKIHARRKHKLVDAAAQVFGRANNSVAGSPRCSECLKKISRFQTLEWHINHHACPVINTTAAHDTQTATSVLIKFPSDAAGKQSRSSLKRL